MSSPRPVKIWTGYSRGGRKDRGMVGRTFGAISRHPTKATPDHYSTVTTETNKQAIAKVIELAGFRNALDRGHMTAEVVCTVVCAASQTKSRPAMITDGPYFPAYFS
jgi:hypothetical protein